MLSVFTTTSFAPSPVRSATEVLQSLNPSGLNIGAITFPI